jgi:hypothetical protein
LISTHDADLADIDFEMMSAGEDEDEDNDVMAVDENYDAGEE